VKTLLEKFADDYFFPEVAKGEKHGVAFEIANEKFEAEHTFPAFNTYDCFRMKWRRERQKKTR
jgi:hypothetical protein